MPFPLQLWDGSHFALELLLNWQWLCLAHSIMQTDKAPRACVPLAFLVQ